MANRLPWCGRCVHARKMTWWKAPLPPGHVRCAHPALRMKCAAVTGARPSAADNLEIRGPMDSKDPRHKRFFWPWNFYPGLLWNCLGFKEDKKVEPQDEPIPQTAAQPQKETA